MIFSLKNTKDKIALDLNATRVFLLENGFLIKILELRLKQLMKLRLNVDSAL